MDSDFAAWTAVGKTRIEKILASFLPPPDAAPQILSSALRYTVLGHGKRIRPLLVLAAAELGNTIAATVDCRAAAVEFMHTYSLIHDDLPAMDNDALRHGKATCHVQYGEAMAVLTGDTLQALAFEILSGDRNCPAEKVRQALELLAKSCGFTGMCGGQALDLINTDKKITEAQLIQMHRQKTGALIKAAVLLGLTATDLSHESLYRDINYFADNIGLAFQITDDILDYEQSTAALGKTAGKDQQEKKATFVNIMGVKAAAAAAATLVSRAVTAAETYLPRSQNLINLARFITCRPN